MQNQIPKITQKKFWLLGIVFNQFNSLRNLISNANKFTKEGIITVYAQKDDGQIILSISDTGIGMAEEIKGRLFDGEHYQSTTGTSNEKSSGLGLIFTKDFIDILGGSIKVESTLNKGTCVYIYF